MVSSRSNVGGGIFTFEGNGHELSWQGIRIESSGSLFEGNRSIFRGVPMNFLRG
jgi:hypothetical protein